MSQTASAPNLAPLPQVACRQCGVTLYRVATKGLLDQRQPHCPGCAGRLLDSVHSLDDDAGGLEGYFGRCLACHLLFVSDTFSNCPVCNAEESLEPTHQVHVGQRGTRLTLYLPNLPAVTVFSFEDALAYLRGMKKMWRTVHATDLAGEIVGIVAGTRFEGSVEVKDLYV